MKHILNVMSNGLWVEIARGSKQQVEDYRFEHALLTRRDTDDRNYQIVPLA